MNTTILFYVSQFVNDWLETRYNYSTSTTLKKHIKRELGENWLDRIHKKCLIQNQQITKNQVSNCIKDVELVYRYVDRGYSSTF